MEQKRADEEWKGERYRKESNDTVQKARTNASTEEGES